MFPRSVLCARRLCSLQRSQESDAHRGKVFFPQNGPRSGQAMCADGDRLILAGCFQGLNQASSKRLETKTTQRKGGRNVRKNKAVMANVHVEDVSRTHKTVSPHGEEVTWRR